MDSRDRREPGCSMETMFAEGLGYFSGPGRDDERALRCFMDAAGRRDRGAMDYVEYFCGRQRTEPSLLSTPEWRVLKRLVQNQRKTDGWDCDTPLFSLRIRSWRNPFAEPAYRNRPNLVFKPTGLEVFWPNGRDAYTDEGASQETLRKVLRICIESLRGSP